MTGQLSVLVAIAAVCSVLLYAGCNATTEAPTAEPSPTEQANRSSGFGEYGTPYFGLVSMEELIVNSDAIVRAEFVSAAQTIEPLNYVYPDGNQHTGYAGAVVITFNVLEYLKGSGGNQIEAVLYDGDWQTYKRADITAANEDFLAFRDKQWDDREAIVFLRKTDFVPSTRSNSDRYTMGFGYLRANGEHGYTVDSRWTKAWLPAAAAPSSNGQASGASRASGDSQRFITNIEDGATGGGVRGQSGGQTETMTIAEIKAVITKIDNELAVGEGITGYAACVRDKYAWTRQASRAKEGRGNSYNRQFDASITSGAAAGAKVYTGGDYVKISEASRAAEPSWSDDLVVKSGQDAELFAHTWPLLATTARPLPAGTYRFYWAEQGRLQALCDAMPEAHRTRNEIVVTVTPPLNTLHEALFDPVSLASGVGADLSNGVLNPTAFTVDGTSTSITSLKWDNGSVVLTLSPYTSLAGQKLDFIELDGSVGLSLPTSSATEDTTAGTLTWSLTDQPWHDGDTLMLRIAASTTPEPTPQSSSSVTVTLSPRMESDVTFTNMTIDWTDPAACNSRYLVGIYTRGGDRIIRNLGFHPAPATVTVTSETGWVWGYITNQDWWARVTCAPSDGSEWSLVGEIPLQSGLPDAP